MKRATSTTLGWVLWRGGLYFCSAYLAYEGWIRTWRFLVNLELPTPLLWAIVLVLIGSLAILGSLVVERVQDARNETGLSDD